MLVVCFCYAIKTLSVYLTCKFKWDVWVHGLDGQKTDLVYGHWCHQKIVIDTPYGSVFRAALTRVSTRIKTSSLFLKPVSSIWMRQFTEFEILLSIRFQYGSTEFIDLAMMMRILLFNSTKICMFIVDKQWAGFRSRYSDCLRAERSGDRIPVGRGEIFRTCTDRPWGPPSLL